MFLIVCVTFLKRVRFSGLFTSPLYSKGGVLHCLRHFLKMSEVFWTFIKRGKCFELFGSLLDSERSVFNRLCHFYKTSDVFELFKTLYIAMEVFYIVFVTFR